MLLSLTRKLCPYLLVPSALMAIGCGKKISDKDPAIERSGQTAELPSAYSIRMNGSEGSRKIHPIPHNGHFKIPRTVYVRQGTGINKVFKMTFNHDVNEADQDTENLFICDYSPIGNPQEMILIACYDGDGRRWTDQDITHNEFQLLYGRNIKLEVITGSAIGMDIEVILSMVDWI